MVTDVVDLTESDDEDVRSASIGQLTCAIQSPLTDRCTSSSKGCSVSASLSPHSSVGLSSPSPVAVFYLSPVRVMPASPQGPAVPASPLRFVMTPPPPLGQVIPTSPRNFMITPPPLGPPPLAHSGLHLSYHPPVPSKISSQSLFGCTPYPPLPSTSGGSPFQYPGSLFRSSPCDPLGSSSVAVLDFLSLVSSFSDYSSNFTLPPNTFDYLYQNGTNTAAASAGSTIGLDSFAGTVHGTSSPRSWFCQM